MNQMFVHNINNQVIEAPPGGTLLHLLQKHKFTVPALCFHSKLKPQGSCGLCLVEKYTNNTWHLIHACLTPVTEPLTIRTISPTISNNRAVIAKLLLTHAPFNDPAVQALLSQLADSSADTLTATKPIGCILCGLCVEVCQTIGKNNLTFLGKGANLKISYTSHINNCGKCKACAKICPTKFIDEPPHTCFTAALY